MHHVCQAVPHSPKIKIQGTSKGHTSKKQKLISTDASENLFCFYHLHVHERHTSIYVHMHARKSGIHEYMYIFMYVKVTPDSNVLCCLLPALCDSHICIHIVAVSRDQHQSNISIRTPAPFEVGVSPNGQVSGYPRSWTPAR